MFQRRNVHRRLLLVGFVAALAVALSACSGTSASVSGPTSNATSADTKAFVAKVAADVKAGSTDQTPESNPVPGDAPTLVKDKSLVIIPCSMAVEGCARPARSTKEAAELLGWKVTIDDPSSDGSKISAAIQRAISSKADGILLTSTDAAPFQGDIKSARDAGIAVVCSMCGNVDDLYEAVIPPLEQNNKAGYLLGEYAFIEAKARFDSPPKFIILTDDEFNTVKARVAGLKEFIADCQAAGAGCEQVAEGSFLAAEISTSAPGRVVQLARGNPTYNVLFAGFDAAMLFISQGLQQASLTDPSKAFGISVDADVANTEMIRTGGFQAASIGFAFDRAGFGQVDNLNRIFNEQNGVDQGVTGKLITVDNAPATGGWDGDFDANALYKASWSLK